MGVASKLEKRLQAEYGATIHVVDPVDATFNYVKTLLE